MFRAKEGDYIRYGRAGAQAHAVALALRWQMCVVRTGENRIPKWQLSDTCVDCDKHFDTAAAPEWQPPVVKPDWVSVQNATACDGIWSDYSKFGEKYHDTANMHSCGTKYADANGPTCLKQITATGMV
jgi:hypothetical protein